jgi:hypothetical protein
MTTTCLFKLAVLGAYNGGVPFRVYQDGGPRVHGAIFEIYFQKTYRPFKFELNQN